MTRTNEGKELHLCLFAHVNHVTTKPPAVPTHLYIKVFVIHDAIAHISALGLYHTDLLPRGGKPVITVTL